MTRVLLTGGAGFIGSNFLEYALTNTDWEFVSLDRLDDAGNQQNYADLLTMFPGRLRLVWHDLKAPINPAGHAALRQEFTYVIHMAAMSHVDRSIKDPICAIMDNVLGTGHLLQYCREYPAKKILYFSTDEVFGPAAPGVTYNEYGQHTPNNPYAASKAGGEALIPAFANTYGLPLMVTHCTNVYGPRQFSEKFIPLVTRQVLNGEIVQIHSRHGVPATRFFVHCDDVSRAVLTILEKGGTWGGVNTGKFNISGNFEHSILSVAEQIARVLDKPLQHELVEHVANRPNPDMRYSISSTRLERLGWRPLVDFEDGIRSTVEALIRPDSPNVPNLLDSAPSNENGSLKHGITG